MTGISIKGIEGVPIETVYVRGNYFHDVGQPVIVENAKTLYAENNVATYKEPYRLSKEEVDKLLRWISESRPFIYAIRGENEGL